jgi:hypothetical protein
MTALTEGFTNLKVQKASGTVSTKLENDSDVQSHLASLKSEMQRFTTAVPQAWIQTGLQVAIDKAVHNMEMKINSGNVNDPETQRGRSPAPTGYSSPEADLESGKGSERLGSASPKRRARFLGPGHFHGSYASITPSIFGTVYLTTSTFYVYDPMLAEDRDGDSANSEIETHFTFYPASWLMWWGLKYGVHVVLSREGASWKNTLQTFQAVPDDSLVFEFCEQGNLMAVNSLLRSGRASPWDTNSKGWTPLHVSSHCWVHTPRLGGTACVLRARHRQIFTCYGASS